MKTIWSVLLAAVWVCSCSQEQAVTPQAPGTITPIFLAEGGSGWNITTTMKGFAPCDTALVTLSKQV